MADEQNQNQQQKQKGGNGGAPKAGITLGTSVSAVGNSNLGETIRGALCDSFGYMMGCIFTGVTAHFLNKAIAKFKPTAQVADVFPAKSEGPTAREIMSQMHNLARTNPEEAQRILASVGSRFQQPQQATTPEPKVETPAPKPEATPAPAPVTKAETKQTPKAKTSK